MLDLDEQKQPRRQPLKKPKEPRVPAAVEKRENKFTKVVWIVGSVIVATLLLLQIVIQLTCKAKQKRKVMTDPEELNSEFIDASSQNCAGADDSLGRLVDPRA